VNFWSPRAGPCLMLMPRLLKLAEEFGGRFLLVRLNTDEHGRLARDWGVTSIPTTKVFRHGRVVDTLHGAESETSVRALLAHAGFLGAARDAPPAEALEQTIAADPDDLDARYRLAAVRLTGDNYEGAMVQPLEIARRDPGFRDGAARNGLFAVFTLLGEQDPRTRHYRDELQKLIK